MSAALIPAAANQAAVLEEYFMTLLSSSPVSRRLRVFHRMHRAEADGEAVPHVDCADEDGELHDLVVAEMRLYLFEHLVRHVGLGDQRKGVGPGEGGALARAVE